MDEMVGEFYSLCEMTVSQSAARAGLKNDPPPAEKENLKALCKEILDPLHRKVGKVIVNSGYRSLRVNRLVGGADKSQHTKGQAADIIVPGKSVAEVVALIRELKLPFDQLIDEFGAWVHVSFVKDAPRGEVLKARKKGKLTVYSKAV